MREADSGEILRKQAADVIVVGCGDRFLRVHHFNRIRHANGELILGLLKILQCKLVIALSSAYLIVGDTEIDIGIAHVELNNAAFIGQFCPSLRDGCICLCRGCADPSALKDGDIQRRRRLKDA